MRWLILVALGLITTNAHAAGEIDPAHSGFLADVQEKLPVMASPVCDGSRLSDFRLLGKGPKADYSFVPVEGQLFSRAIRVKVGGRTEPTYQVQVLIPPTTQPLKKGEHILAVVNARCTTAPDGAGLFVACIQGGAPTWTGISWIDVALGADWKRIYIHGQAKQDFPAGGYDLTLHLGSQAQTLEIGGIALLNLGTNGGKTWKKAATIDEASVIGFGKPADKTDYPAIFLEGKKGTQTGLFRSTDEGATWDFLTDYPLGIFDKIITISGDMDQFGRVYVAFSGNGFAYGQPENKDRQP